MTEKKQQLWHLFILYGARKLSWSRIRLNNPRQLAVQTLAVSTQPLCAIACVNIHTHFKNPKHWQPCLAWTQENIAHTGPNG